jgi:choline dehydrogenase-like flavoprotein
MLQSLARGGLSEAWGGVCAPLSEDELEMSGIPAADMQRFYQQAMHEVGISGTEGGYETLPNAQMEPTMRAILARYHQLPHAMRERAIVREPLLALLTKAHRGRSATEYHDLDYYISDDTAIYRARYTIEALEKKGLEYQGGRIVQRIQEEGSGCTVLTNDLVGHAYRYQAKRVILAAGSIGSTRIAAASGFATAPHVFVKPNHLLACINLRALGNPGVRRRHSLCQLTVSLGELYAHVYTYRSLLLWKLTGFSPLAAPETLSLLSMFAPSLVIVDARLPGVPCAVSYDGTLSVAAPKERADERAPLNELKRFLRKLGVLPLRIVDQPLGASTHYAGGLAVDASGRLKGAARVFVADAAGWTYLSGKPPALTIMANAQRIGEEVSRQT